MAEASVSTDEDRFSCTICLERYKHPKLLPCFHTFCRSCLDTYITKHGKHGEFNCPLCRSTIAIQGTGAEGFQSNLYIETTKEGDMQPIQCDLCGPDEQAVHRCEACEENLCSRCSNAHLKSKLTRGHTLIEIAVLDPKSKWKIISREFCTEHSGQEMLFVCKQCDNKILCMVCKLVGHETHVTADIKTEAREVRSLLTASLKSKQLNEFFEKEKNNMSRYEQGKEELELFLDNELKLVRTQAQRLHQAIDDIAKTISKTIRERYDVDMEQFSEAQQDTEKALESKEQIKAITHLVLDHDNNIELIRKGRSLAKSLQACQDRKIEMEVIKEPLFKAGSINQDTLKCLFGALCEISLLSAKTKKTRFSFERMQKECFKHLKTITLPNDTWITGIAPVGNNKAWVSSFLTNNVHFIDIEGKVEKSIDAKARVTVVAANSSKECTVSCLGPKCIKHITASGEVKTIIDSLPYYPQGLAYRTGSEGQEQLLYTCTDKDFWAKKGTAYIQLGKGTGSSIALDIQAPFRVAVDQDSQHICVADICRDKGKVTIYDSEGKLLSTYTDAGLRPCGLWFCSPDCILVVNYSKDVRVINAVDSRSKILVESTNDYISVAVDGNFMWVGRRNGKIDIYALT